MAKDLLLFLLLSITSNLLFGQRTITGKVISKSDKSTLPGVTVVEKGTTNGTTTTIDGDFTLHTSKYSPVLVFSFIGLVTKEVVIKESDHITVELQDDCVRDYFDVQEIFVYLMSGLINNPIGGKIDMSFRPVIGKGTFRGGISYQTNLKDDYFSSAQIEYNHFIWTCDYELNAGWYHRDIDLSNQFKVLSNSFETKQTFDRVFNSTLILGYSHLNFQATESNYTGNSNGLLIGTQLWTGNVLKAIITTKAAIHGDFIEWQGEAKKRVGPLNTFVYYYRLDTFSELSLGLGYEFHYRFRRKN